ncbi:MAG TPA: rhomboid family intramembrane serine protease [Gaiellaceae bacterium]|jgi:membrane associated rhomboid family serine protease|nr:rhomboid family intramembrane serine protease [Gaiellaceae bacterium]
MATPEQTQTQVCYRHPRTETAVSCSNCGRPICTDCMVFSAVGIKCPECAGRQAPTKRAATRVRSVAGEGSGFIVTKALIAVNVLVYLAQATEGGNLWNPTGKIFQEGYLRAYEVASGDWWRLVTAAFLHANPLHIFFNMLMLWWFGRPLETLLGRGRFLAVYFLSILAGSAGALLVTPTGATIGASGAVFGILGAGLILERNRIDVFGGSALLVVLVNLALSLTLNYVSIGGHVGGLIGGALTVLVLSGWGRRHAVYGRIDVLVVAGLVGIAVASVGIAYMRARGYA